LYSADSLVCSAQAQPRSTLSQPLATGNLACNLNLPVSDPRVE